MRENTNTQKKKVGSSGGEACKCVIGVIKYMPMREHREEVVWACP